MRRLLAAIAVIVLVAPLASRAQSFAPGTPEAATIAYIDAVRDGQLDRMAAMMHPEALASFRGVLQPVVDLADASDESATEVLQMFDGVSSIAQLKQLDDARFFLAFYRAISALQPEIVYALKDSEAEVFGHVMEGDDTAHVVYRMTLSVGATMVKTEVISLRRTKTGWGVLLTGEIEGIAEGIRQSIEMGQQLTRSGRQ